MTLFLFRTLSAGETELRLVERFGVAARTLVTGGEGGGNVMGQLGPSAQVMVVECLPPIVSVIGSRYLSLTPAPGELPVGILVEGDTENPDVACVSQYVQAGGRLGASLVLRTPSEWGTMHVGDLEIVPNAIYDVRASYGQAYGLSLLSESRSAVTWMWGDVDDSGAVNFDDIMLVINGSQGVFRVIRFWKTSTWRAASRIAE